MDSHYFPFCTSLPHPALFKPATLRTPSSTAFSVLFYYQARVGLSNFTSRTNLDPSSSRSRSPPPPKGLCIPADLGSRSSLLFTLSTHLGDHT